MNKVRLEDCRNGDYIRWWEKDKEFSEGGTVYGAAYTTGMKLLGLFARTNTGRNAYVECEKVAIVHNYGQPLKL